MLGYDRAAATDIQRLQRPQQAVRARQRADQQDGAVNDGEQAGPLAELTGAGRVRRQRRQAAHVDARHEYENAPQRQCDFAG